MCDKIKSEDIVNANNPRICWTFESNEDKFKSVGEIYASGKVARVFIFVVINYI